jgi:hypothetical protein
MPGTISVNECITQLGMSEDEFRLLLVEIYPDTWEEITEILVEEFELITKTLNGKVNGLAIAPSKDSSLPPERQQKIIAGTNTVLTDFAECLTLDSNRIATALATIIALKSKQVFDQTFSHVFYSGVNQSLQSRAAEVQNLAHQTNISPTTTGFTRVNLDGYLNEVEKMVGFSS